MAVTRTTGVVLIVLALWVGTAWAGDIYVDINDGGCVSGTGQADPYGVVYCSIQDAITDAAPSDTIHVAAGTYPETVVIDKQLTLRGAGSANTIIDASAESFGILITAGGTSAVQRLRIEDLSITDALQNGIRSFQAAGFNLHYVTFDGVVVTDSAGAGVELHNGTNVLDMEIINCDFVDNGGFGLSASSETPVDGLLIEDSHFDRNSFGIYLETDTVNVTIRNSTMNENIQRGYWGSNGRVSNLLIEDCEANSNLQRGITVWSYDPVNGIDGATIRRTSMDNNGFRGFHIGAATDYSETVATTITNVLLENCSLTGNGDMGFHVDLGLLSNVEIHDCDLSGNTNLGVKHINVPISSGTVDASGNWWGDLDPTDDRAGSVDYTPWLDVATDTSGDPGFQGDFSELWVDDDSPQTGGLGYIEEALGLVTTSTINLAPGTYEEQVEIDTNGLELIGSGSGTNGLVDSIIRSPVGPLPYYFVTGTNNNYPVIAVHDCTGVSIESLRVDGYGRGNSNYRFVGIGFWNAGGDVVECAVTNIQDTPFTGAQHGVGIYAYNDTGGPYTINVTETDVDEYQKNAMALSGTALTANVTGCTATGKGAIPTTAQNGIQISSGAGGTIDGCTVSGHMYTGGGWASTGVLLLSGTSVDVTDTEITDNNPGVYCQDTSATFDGLTVSNQHADSWDGLYAYNTTGTLKRGGSTPRAAAAPFEPADVQGTAKGRAAMTVSVTGSQFVGHDKADSWGVAAFATGTDTVNLNLGTSLVKDWDYGVVAYDWGGPATVTANYNQIFSNVTLGFLNTFAAAVMDAEYNWWGHASGPADPSGSDEADNPPCFDPSTMKNAGGTGNGVSDLNVDYCPWLGGAGELVFEATDCQDDAYPGEGGYQVVYELWMRDLTQNATGFQAFVAYDTAKLSYRGDLSSYTNSPFPQHIQNINQADDALLNLDGSDVGGGTGTDADSLLATLVFDVDVECETAQLTFTSFGPFGSELSFEGVPLPTGLTASPAITLDDTPPVITCPDDLTVECDEPTDPADPTWSVQNIVDNDDAPFGLGQGPGAGEPRSVRGLALSPDNDYLYLGYNQHKQLRKVDLSVTDPADSCALVAEIYFATLTPSEQAAYTGNYMPDSLDNPKAVATDDVGRVFVTRSTAIQVFDADLTTLLLTITGFSTVNGVHVARMDGTHLYVYASDRGLPEVYRMVLADAAITGGGSVTRASVLDPVFDGDGIVDVGLDSGGNATNDMRGLVSDIDGNVWVAENDGTLFQVIPAAGEGASTVLKRALAGAFDVAIEGDRVYVSSSGRKVTVVDRNDINIVLETLDPFAVPLGPNMDKLEPLVGSATGIDLISGEALFLAIEGGSSAPQSGESSFSDVNCDGADPNPAADDDNDPVLRFVTAPLPGIATATDDCDPAPAITYSDVVNMSGCGGYTGTITRTWTATDVCGNSSSCVQTVTVADTTPPVLSGCPGDITVNADAGGCDAVVTWTDPTATDNCDPAPGVVCSPPSGSTFPQGTTAVTCTATDSCGNASTCGFNVIVNDVNDVSLEIELADVHIPVTRCIYFVTDSCGSTADASLSFTDHDGDDSNMNGIDDATEGDTDDPSTPVRFVGTVEIPCGDWTFLCAKDEQHTLYDTTTLTDTGTTYVADSLLSLEGGDTDNDSDVDINDVTWLLFQFGSLAASGGFPWDGTRDADFSNNGAVGSEDYTFLTANWLTFTTCACTGPPPVGGGGSVLPLARPTKVTVLASELPASVAAKADLTGDGVVDYQDVEAFELAHGLPHALSTKIRQTAQTQLQEPAAPAGRPVNRR